MSGNRNRGGQGSDISVLVLEDGKEIQNIIQLIADRVGENFCCEFVGSIAEFKSSFQKGKYKAVILDNGVSDGRAIEQDVAQWVWSKNRNVEIAFNSGMPFEELEKRLGIRNLDKDPRYIKLFFARLKNGI